MRREKVGERPFLGARQLAPDEHLAAGPPGIGRNARRPWSEQDTGLLEELARGGRDAGRLGSGQALGVRER